MREPWLGRVLLAFAVGIVVVAVDAATHDAEPTPAGRPSSSRGPIECDRFAAVGGSDSATGSIDDPYATVQHLVDSLQPGQTGCLRAGTYPGIEIDPKGRPGYAETKLRTPQITLASYPGERARIVGRLWIAASGVTVANLDLEGVNPARYVASSLTIGGERVGPPIEGVRVIGNDITNDHQRICVNLGAPGYGRPQGTLIETNRIHDCGVYEYPPDAVSPPEGREFTGHWNEDHGIYVSLADHTVIRHNLIYDNASRGVQLYPDSQRSVVTENVIDNNGEGVGIGGDDETSSSYNLVEGNAITASSERFNVEHSFADCEGAADGCPTGNVIRTNCLATDSAALDYIPGAGPTQDELRGFYEADGGVLDPDSAEAPYKAVNDRSTPSHNLVFEPAADLYVDRAARDFRLDPAFACAVGIGANLGSGLARWTAAASAATDGARPAAVVNAFGADGTEAIAWSEADADHSVIRVAVRVPRVPRMSAPAPAAWEVSTVSGDGDSRDPAIRVDASGDVAVVWAEDDGGGARVMVTARQAATGAWAEPAALSAPAGDLGAPALDVAGDGSAAVAWRRGSTVEAATGLLTGSWEAGVVLGAGAGADSAPRIAVADGGLARAVWVRALGGATEIVSTSRPAAGAWSEPERISSGGGDVADPVLGIGAGGDAVALWRGREHGAWVVRGASASGAGSAWSAIDPLSDPDGDAGAPAVGVAADGSAIASWAPSADASVVQWSRRAPGGPFSKPATLSAGGEDVSAPQLAVAADGTAIAAWSDFDAALGYRRVRAAVLGFGASSEVASLSDVLVVASPSEALDLGAIDPAVAIGPHGSGLVAWHDRETVGYARRYP